MSLSCLVLGRTQWRGKSPGHFRSYEYGSEAKYRREYKISAQAGVLRSALADTTLVRVGALPLEHLFFRHIEPGLSYGLDPSVSENYPFFPRS